MDINLDMNSLITMATKRDWLNHILKKKPDLNKLITWTYLQKKKFLE